MRQTSPGARLRALHQPGHPFVLANAWDAGSARVLAALGAQAIGTTSAGHAFTLGVADMGHVTRDQALAHAADLVAATALPVSGDFEDGFGADPDTVAQTIRLAAEVGLAGCSIEDTALPGTTAYPRDHAIERIRAAASAARSLPEDFVLVARADGVMNGQYDIEEALARVTAFAAAGADCIYIPLPATMADLARICAAVEVPVNALASGPFATVTRAEFAALGVARISVGAALARATQRTLIDAARAMLDSGDFSKLGGISAAEIERMLADGTPAPR